MGKHVTPFMPLGGVLKGVLPNPKFSAAALAQMGALTPTLPVTTKGDLLGFDTAADRLPVGADGTLLVADSTQPLGLKWSGTTAGAAGAPGSVWREGSGVPDSSVGIDGDFYLNGTTGDVYQRASGSYGIVANITGPRGIGSAGAAATIAVGTVSALAAGATPTVVNSGTTAAALLNFGIPNGAAGSAGSRGSLWYEGTGVPGTISGQANNDFYLNTSTSDVWQLQSGSWVLVENIQGANAPTTVRTTATVTTSSHSQVTGTVSMAKTFRLQSIASATAVRFRLYATVAQRNADVARPSTTYPSAYSGLIGEWVFDGSTVFSINCAPIVEGSNMESTPVATIAYTLDPPASGSSTINMTYQGLE